MVPKVADVCPRWFRDSSSVPESVEIWARYLKCTPGDYGGTKVSAWGTLEFSEVYSRWLRYTKDCLEVTNVCSWWLRYTLGKSEVTRVCPRCLRYTRVGWSVPKVFMRRLKCGLDILEVVKLCARKRKCDPGWLQSNWGMPQVILRCLQGAWGDT
jgi:hypothetical protein